MLECLRDFVTSQQIAFASLFNSRLSVEPFFELPAYDLDLRCSRSSKTEVLWCLNNLCLNNLLLERASAGRTTKLIVDEAHDLGWEVLEEIRLLGNLENRHGKLLQIVLAGQRGAGRKTGAAGVPAIETAHRDAVGARRFSICKKPTSTPGLPGPGVPNQTLIPRNIIHKLYFRSQGIHRVINAICGNLLHTRFARETRMATARNARRSDGGHAP